jgi:hypothetical protein
VARVAATTALKPMAPSKVTNRIVLVTTATTDAIE